MRFLARLVSLSLLLASWAAAQSGNQIVVAGPTGPIASAGSGLVVAILPGGSVNGGAGAAISIGPGGFVSVVPNGVVTGDRALVTPGGAVRVLNGGLFQSTGGDALDLVGSLTLGNSGTILGAVDGVDLAGTGVVINSGRIEGGTDGVDMNTGMVVNSGVIRGVLSDGIEFDQPGTGTVVNAGSIVGQRGIQHSAVGGYLDLNNSGTIQGTADYGAGSGSGRGSVVNSGTIVGLNEGVRFEGTAASSVRNVGTIRGLTDAGVEMDGGPVVNYGVIEGATSGIEFQNGAPGFVDNRGRITGAAFGISIDTDGAAIVNHGTIEGVFGIVSVGPATIENHGVIRAPGWAILLAGAGNSLVDLHTGSVIQGDMINGGLGTADLRLFGVGSYGGNVIGFRTLENRGDWTLGGVVTLAGSAQVVSGRLIVNGVLNGGDLISVFAGGTLGGNGIVNGPTAVLPFGRVNPGSSIGTLRLARTVEFQPGSALVIELQGAPFPASDVLQVTAALELVTIRDGAILAPVVDSGYLRQGDRFTVLTTADPNGVQGTFRLGRPSAVIGARAFQTGNSITLEIDRLSYREVATTPNAKAIALSLDSVVDSATGDLRRALNQLDRLSFEDFQSALGSIDPVVFDASREVGLRSYRSVGQAVDAHLYALHEGSLLGYDVTGDVSADGGERSGEEEDRPEGRVWAGSYGLFSENDEEPDVAEYEAVSTGPRFGWDYVPSDELAFGMFSGISLSEIAFERSNDASAEHDAYTLGIHGTLDHPIGIQAHLMVYGGVDEYENRRVIRFGTIDRFADSDHDGFHVGSRLGGRYLWSTGSWALGPTLYGDYVHQGQDSFTEHGAGSLDLEVESREVDSIESGLGFTVRYEDVSPVAILTPRFRAQWIREWLDGDRGITAALAGGSGPRFTVRGDDPVRDGVLLGVGFDVYDRSSLRFGFDYDVFLDEDVASHTIRGALEIRF